MHTLKVQLGLTLSALLFISMFLFGFVMLMLWQRSEIHRETEINENLLHFTASSIIHTETSKDISPLPGEIIHYLEERDILCLQWHSRSNAPIQSYGSCPEDISLKPLLKKSAITAKTTTDYAGMSWNGFFFSKHYLLMATPLVPENSDHGAIALVRSLEDISATINQAQKIFFAYLVINLLIFTTIGFTRLVHLVIKPIQRLAKLADSRTELDDTTFLSGEGLGEYTQLSLSLNRLVSRIDGDKQELRQTVKSLEEANDELQRNRDEMIRTEKLASIGRLSAGLAHEIGNPLGIIQGYIDLLKEESLSIEDKKTFSERATQELNRINTLIRNLLDLSRSPVASSVELIDLHLFLEDLIKTVSVRKTISPVHYTTELNALNSKVNIDSNGLRQVFLNCILNSIDAIDETAGDEDGKISIETKSTEEQIQIILKDNGSGINPENKDAIFDPFFTTKEVGKGTGLGLAVAHNLIKKSGGTIRISSDTNEGTSVIITLPLATEKIISGHGLNV